MNTTHKRKKKTKQKRRDLSLTGVQGEVYDQRRSDEEVEVAMKEVGARLKVRK